jgi:hypothetical protein
MAQQKYTIYKYVRLKGGWRYCPAALYANHTIKADVVIVGGKEEKHAEGNYYLCIFRAMDSRRPRRVESAASAARFTFRQFAGIRATLR